MLSDSNSDFKKTPHIQHYSLEKGRTTLPVNRHSPLNEFKERIN
jgi:hypothetical protein